ncbi:MAG: HAD family hydrolase [Gammaproteobacteria bacterium]|nr:HAD family hydrolase [Gammaproteobacteria bacterium]
MPLALFDLDNTLLAGDSDYLWGQFLVEQNIVDPIEFAKENKRFYIEYERGELDIKEFLAFQLKPLGTHNKEQLHRWREQFLHEKIDPIILPGARDLLKTHTNKGDTPLIITATNRFITGPIAEIFGVEHLLATEVEIRDGEYTGQSTDTPCFQQGKVERLERWLAEHDVTLDDSFFYSDSHNDLPLLKLVSHPVAVDPDDILREYANQQGWPIISLR